MGKNKERMKIEMKHNNKTNMIKKGMGMMAAMALLVPLLAGCGQNNGAVERAGNTARESSNVFASDAGTGNAGGEDSSGNRTDTEDAVSVENPSGKEQAAESGSTQLEVRFGDNGEAFMMMLLDNETAAAIAGYVGTSDWRLPIYERDDDADYSVLQYYDIPSRYEIPSDNPETVTEAKAGDVFYSDPNRIVLFYHDAEISAEYTKIGTFEATEDFITAVEENPVLEGWGNKIIQISQP